MTVLKNQTNHTIRLVSAFLFFLIINTTATAQHYFTPTQVNDNLYNQMYAAAEGSYAKTLQELPAKNKKDLQEIYGRRWQNIKNAFDKKEMYTHPEATAYLDKILNEIVQNNPALQGKPFKCYFSRSGIPNASYIGEGIILINMGLFSLLENESQLAFVIGHEIAHFYLQHSEKRMNDHVATLNSDEFQKELKDIKKAAYGKRREVERLMMDFTFDSRRHGRNHESSADSMALVFVQNTRFDSRESVTALQLLDSIDQERIDMQAALKHVFENSEYPFQTRWIKKEEGLLGGHTTLKTDNELADSLKTHPDCQQRIALLQPAIARLQQNEASKNSIDPLQFQKLKELFKYEVIEYAFTSENYTRSLFYTIELMLQKPGDAYLIVHTGKIFNGFFEAQNKRIFGKVTELPSPAFPAQYNLLLQFVQNLYKEEYAAIGYFFLKQHRDQFQHNTAFQKTFEASRKNVQP